MSSVYVRTQIKNFLAANSSEDVIDITAAFEEIKELVADYGIQPDAPWLGLQFVGGQEIPVALAATNDQGKYREFGSVIFHIVDQAKIGIGDSLLTRGEALINLFRGQRIGDIIIDGFTLMNTEAGATLEFEGGYVSGSFQMSFYRDLDL